MNALPAQVMDIDRPVLIVPVSAGLVRELEELAKPYGMEACEYAEFALLSFVAAMKLKT